MENKELISLFFQIIAIMLTMLGMAFGLWKGFSSKIDSHFKEQKEEFEKHKKDNADAILRVYQRMTEKCNELVPNELYQLELKHQREMMDGRFSTVMDFLKIKFDSLEKVVEKLVKHDEEK